MLVDILPIRQKNGFDLIVKQIYNIPLLECTADVSIEGILTCKCNDSDCYYVFSGSIKGEISASCAKCLLPLVTPFNEYVNFVIAEIDSSIVDSSIQDDIYFFEGSAIDFLPITESIVISCIPMRFICSEQCKGLCATCGKVIVSDSICCPTEYENPVFAQLKNLFD